jgi:hypothetical protein
LAPHHFPLSREPHSWSIDNRRPACSIAAIIRTDVRPPIFTAVKTTRDRALRPASEAAVGPLNAPLIRIILPRGSKT